MRTLSFICDNQVIKHRAAACLRYWLPPCID